MIRTLPNPLTIGLTAASAIGGLFGNKRPRVKDPRIDPFSFQFDENDADLALLRSRILQEGERGKYDAINELGRAGLLGTSAGFAQLDTQRNAKERLLSSARASVMSNRRAEALQLYRDELEYKRKKAFLEAGYDADAYSQNRELLGDVGSSLVEQLLMKDEGNNYVEGSQQDPYFIGPDDPNYPSEALRYSRYNRGRARYL